MDCCGCQVCWLCNHPLAAHQTAARHLAVKVQWVRRSRPTLMSRPCVSPNKRATRAAHRLLAQGSNTASNSAHLASLMHVMPGYMSVGCGPAASSTTNPKPHMWWVYMGGASPRAPDAWNHANACSTDKDSARTTGASTIKQAHSAALE